MKCPRCDSRELHETLRDGITIDLCPQCRGIWLDRGELERLQAMVMDDRAAAASRGAVGAWRDDDDDDDRWGRGGHAGPRPEPRKRGWRGLLELFD